MSIQTYAELGTAVSNWLHRADLSAFAADFITIGEARINREVRAQIQEQRTTAPTSASSAYINLPSDYIEHRSLWLSTGTERQRLEYLAPEAFFERYNAATTGRPIAFTVIGDELRFGPEPDSAYTVELWYWKRLPALSTAVHTLFTSNPDLYLYAALCAAEPFLKNDKRIQVWETLYAAIRDQVNDTERRKRYPTGMRITTA